MDMAKLCVVLLCVCGSWIGSLAIQCDWTTEYQPENDKLICCKACPSGEYPVMQCSKNQDSQCVKCPLDTTKLSRQNQCFCKDKHLCFRDHCQNCTARVRCKPGKYLQRNGMFDYDYTCVKCPNGTYNDAEDSTCKTITKVSDIRCDGEIFPGNQTHNARCVYLDTSADPKPEKAEQNNNQSIHSLMMACLIVTVLSCLVFIMYVAFRIFKYKMFIKLNKHPNSQRYSPDCQLSKEEIGEKHYDNILDNNCDAQLSFV